jgi:hypothetical protein
MTIQRELAAKLLASVADEQESAFQTDRACNTMLARYAGNAALILRFEELAKRFERLLARSKWKNFFGGIITNVRLPWLVPKRLRQLEPIQEIETKHPVFASEFAVTTITRYYPEFLPCIDRGFDELLSVATTELKVEEIALSQAILGRYSEALETSLRLNEQDRRENVRFVIAIERYRLEQVDNGQEMQETLDRRTLEGWGGAQFALGICNRMPWCIYPYPDY